MNSRERVLLIVLVAILGAGVVGFVVFRYWVTPLWENSKAIAALEKDNELLDDQWDAFMSSRKKLELARLRSLPADSSLAGAQYIAYLQPLLGKAGLTKIDITPQKGAKIPVSVPIEKVKEVGHQMMTFSVSCEGELDQLIAALDQMQKTPYEHRIKNLSIGRLDQSVKKDASNKLTIRMNVETLLVAGTKNKTGLPSGLEPPPTPEGRKYADIAKRNIFIGYIPAPPQKTEQKMGMDPTPPKPPAPVKTVEEPDDYIPNYVYLTQVVPELKTAYLRNRLYDRPNEETKLIAKENSSYDTFRVTGPLTDLGRWVYFRAKILKVELRQVYFQVGNGMDTEKFQDEDGKRNFQRNGVYVLQIGQPIANARLYSSNWTKTELEDVGLYSRAFEMEEEKIYRAEQAAKQTKDNKGKSKKKGTN